MAVKPDNAELEKKVRELEIEVDRLKATEHFLAESEEKYRTIINSIEEGYYEIDLSGNLTFINNSLSNTIGYSEKELMGMNYRAYSSKKTAKAISAIFNRIYKTGNSARITDYEVIRKDGSTLVLELSASLIRNAKGAPAGFRGVFRDVSDRAKKWERKKKIEAQIQQVKKMEAIETLAGGIAHDFNNLLMGIQGNTSIMLMKSSSKSSLRNNINRINLCIDKGINLTKQLLSFAKVGKFIVMPTSLNKIVKRSADMFKRSKKDLTIHVSFQKGLWRAGVDRVQVGQALLALYMNAADAMDDHGDMYLETENLELYEDYMKPYGLKPGKYIKISVTDTGPGLDDATLQRIFEPFFSPVKGSDAAGLGLASAYGIIKSHDGIINAYSEKGLGTTFNVYLPALKQVDPDEKSGEKQMAGGKETVLIVDDEIAVVEIAGKILGRLGYNVIVAENGEQALRIYKKDRETIDIILLDMVMPDMDGAEVFEKLKQIDNNVLVLLSSGYGLNSQVTQALRKGCRGFVQKPFNLKTLSEKVRSILDNR